MGGLGDDAFSPSSSLHAIVVVSSVVVVTIDKKIEPIAIRVVEKFISVENARLRLRVVEIKKSADSSLPKEFSVAKNKDKRFVEPEDSAVDLRQIVTHEEGRGSEIFGRKVCRDESKDGRIVEGKKEERIVDNVESCEEERAWRAGCGRRNNKRNETREITCSR